MANHTDNDSDNEVSFDDVLRQLRRWHYDEVRSCAEQLAKELRDGLHGSGDDAALALDTALHQLVDGHEHVIITVKAQGVCLASDNDGVCEDETGERPVSVEVQAFYALRADIIEELERNHDVDLNDPCPVEDDDDEEVDHE